MKEYWNNGMDLKFSYYYFIIPTFQFSNIPFFYNSIIPLFLNQ